MKKPFQNVSNLRYGDKRALSLCQLYATKEQGNNVFSFFFFSICGQEAISWTLDANHVQDGFYRNWQ